MKIVVGNKFKESVIFHLLAICLVFLPATVHGQAWPLVYTLGGSGSDLGYSIVVDDTGNYYVAGVFSGTVDFDPSTSVYNLSSAGGYDIFVTKSNQNGNLIWAKRIGGVGDEKVNKMILVDLNHLVLCGEFSGTVNFNPDSTVTNNLVSNGLSDGFILRLKNNGEFRYAKGIGGIGTDNIQGLDLDASNNIYAVGSFENTVDLDPGVSVISANSNGATDIFLLKLSPIGNYITSKTIGGYSIDKGVGVEVGDSFGSIALIGEFTDSIDFDPGLAVNTYKLSFNTTASFVLALNQNLTFKFVKVFEPRAFTCTQFPGCLPSSSFASAIKFDRNKNILITGQFYCDVDLNPSKNLMDTFYFQSAYSLGYYGVNFYVVKLDSNGNFIWATGGYSTPKIFQTSAAGMFQPMDLDVDSSNNVFVTGWKQGTTVFIPSTTPGGGTAKYSYISAYNQFGSNLFLVSPGSISSSYSSVNGIFVSKSQALYFTGNSNSFPQISNQILIGKLSNGGSTLPVQFGQFNVSKIERSIHLDWQTISETNSDYFDIERSENNEDFVSLGKVKSAGNSSVVKHYQFIDKNALSSKPIRKYYYRLKQFDFDGQYTYSPVKVIELDKENEEGMVKIIPNPITDLMTISIENFRESAPFTIVNVFGVSVYEGNVENPITNIDLSHLEDGVYFVVFSKEDYSPIRLVKM